MKRRSTVLAVASCAVVVGTIGALTVGNATAATGGAITGFGGKCVDVAAASSANGTAVQLYDCNGSTAQSWTVGSGDNSIQALGKCLDVAGSYNQSSSDSTTNGAKVKFYALNISHG